MHVTSLYFFACLFFVLLSSDMVITTIKCLDVKIYFFLSCPNSFIYKALYSFEVLICLNDQWGSSSDRTA